MSLFIEAVFQVSSIVAKYNILVSMRRFEMIGKFTCLRTDSRIKKSASEVNVLAPYETTTVNN